MTAANIDTMEHVVVRRPAQSLARHAPALADTTCICRNARRSRQFEITLLYWPIVLLMHARSMIGYWRVTVSVTQCIVVLRVGLQG